MKAFYRCYRPILLPRTAAFLPQRCWGFSAWFLRDLPLRCLPPDGGEVAEIRAPLPLRHFRLPDVLRVRLPSVCAAVFLMKHGLSEALLTQYSAYFLMPPLVLFWIFFFVLVMTQIVAFRKGLTPYRCCVFSMAFGMLVRVFSRGAARQPAAWQRPALRVARHRQRLDVRRAARDDEKSAASVRQGRRPHGKPTL